MPENKEDQQTPDLTPDLPPPVEAPDTWRRPEEPAGEKPPDPEHGPGDDTGTGEPPD